MPSLTNTDDIELFSEQKRYSSYETLGSPDKILLSKDDTMYVFDAKSRESRELFKLGDKNLLLWSAAGSMDGAKVAYSVLHSDKENFGDVRIFDLKTKTHSVVAEIPNLPLYVSMNPVGWNKNTGQLVVKGLGGDAGAVWGDIYLMNPNTKNDYIKISSPNEQSKIQFITGQISPDGTQMAYSYCDDPKGVNEFGGQLNECLGGQQIFLYDFGSKQAKSIYRNTSYGDNTYVKNLRLVWSFMREDSNSLLFTNPEGLFRINAKDDNTILLKPFQWYATDDLIKNPTRVTFANGIYAALEHESTYGGTELIYLPTGRGLTFNWDRQKQSDFTGFIK